MGQLDLCLFLICIVHEKLNNLHNLLKVLYFLLSLNISNKHYLLTLVW